MILWYVVAPSSDGWAEEVMGERRVGRGGEWRVGSRQEPIGAECWCSGKPDYRTGPIVEQLRPVERVGKEFCHEGSMVHRAVGKGCW
jgi:hypothetical protein